MTNKVALITGGSAGIGKATAMLFAQAGAKVVIAARGEQRGREVERLIREQGGEATFIRADVSRPESVKELIEQTVSIFGRLDCAFNNAATLGKIGRTADYTEEDFEVEVASNLKSVWCCMKYEIQQFQKQDPPTGAIVNTSSVNGLGGAPGASLYSMAKAGILALTKSAAQEYAAGGIRINALVAGAFDTEMLRGAISQTVGSDPETLARVLEGYAAKIPAGRIGNPAEAAQAVLWLCGNAASYVTGQSMIVDGGFTAWAR